MLSPVLRSKEFALVSELKTGKTEAFTRLYDQYAPVLLGVINQIVCDDQKAAGLLIETFTDIRSAIETYRPEKQPFFVWLLTRARQTANDAVATQKSAPQATIQLSASGSVAVTQPAHSFAKSVAVAQSPEEKQKQFLNSVLFGNCTPEEAAGSVGLPVASARQQLRDALLKLRR
ncbi:RNA polymerase sigma-70 factor (ECF subfamily) [Spirosoma lacussanchae]|uniref:RNA polymerase sigma factor n=1 Tax=Spirosoma lacussanchae TaxID=1884249 RepID=UPI001108D164|nr:sigma-70 family RNA polymerase sigma factor [Spirosoma lacussanchae]